jgi:hypothetical protein
MWQWALTRILLYTLAFSTVQLGFARKAVDTSNDLYILLDEVSVFSCRGVKNQIKLTEEDVNIVNEKGNRVYFVKAPGNYSLHFKVIFKNIIYLNRCLEDKCFE